MADDGQETLVKVVNVCLRNDSGALCEVAVIEELPKKPLRFDPPTEKRVSMRDVYRLGK